jgi:hypothetical protein
MHFYIHQVTRATCHGCIPNFVYIISVMWELQTSPPAILPSRMRRCTLSSGDSPPGPVHPRWGVPTGECTLPSGQWGHPTMYTPQWGVPTPLGGVHSPGRLSTGKAVPPPCNPYVHMYEYTYTYTLHTYTHPYYTDDTHMYTHTHPKHPPTRFEGGKGFTSYQDASLQLSSYTCHLIWLCY